MPATHAPATPATAASPAATEAPAPASVRRRTPAARGLTYLRAGVTSAALTLLVGSLASAGLSAPPREPHPFDLSTQRVDRLFEHYRCSTTGFAPDVIPHSALVRTTAGRATLVSFEEGWDVFTGKAPGRLMAVCLGPERRTR